MNLDLISLRVGKKDGAASRGRTVFARSERPFGARPNVPEVVVTLELGSQGISAMNLDLRDSTDGWHVGV